MVGLNLQTKVTDDKPKSIFVLRWKYAKEKIIYPAKLYTEVLGYFTDLKKAEYYISFPDKDCYWFLEDYPFKIFEIQECGLNYFLMDDYIRIYDHKGEFYGEHESVHWQEPFIGRENKDCKFKQGDLVEFIQGSRLNVGIIAKLPPDKKRIKEILKANASKNKESMSSGFLHDRYIVLRTYSKSSYEPHVCEVFRPSGKIPKMLEKRLRTRYQNC